MDFDNFYSNYNDGDFNNERECYEYEDIEHETDKAILVKLKKCKESIWLPKSQIDYDDKYIWVPFWLAEKHDLI